MPEIDKKSISYSWPKTVGAFFRELIAVCLLLTLQERAWAYDFFTPGLVLFLILITFRLPYINSYTFIFETSSIGSWAMTNHAGLQKHEDLGQNVLHTIVVLAAHVGGAIGAAALRVYFDATYGKEVMSMQAGVSPALEVNVAALQSLSGSLWSADARIDRLSKLGYPNSTLEVSIPVNGPNDLGIGEFALVFWYVAEEIGYVFLVCVCYVHIWLAAGVANNAHPAINPFKPIYWQRLFRVSVLWSAIYISLYRAFPTAHGSLHRTLYLCQYQAWNPSVHTIDTNDGEAYARVVGGLIGVLLAMLYNQMLIGTEKVDSDDDGSDYFYRMVWGFDRDESHSRSDRTKKRARSSYHEEYEDDDHHQDAQASNANQQVAQCTVCVVCRKQGKTCTCQAPLLRKALRIPGAMNYPK